MMFLYFPSQSDQEVVLLIFLISVLLFLLPPFSAENRIVAVVGGYCMRRLLPWDLCHYNFDWI